MTNEEAIEYIQCALAGGCSQICNSKYRGDCTDELVIKALEIAVNALENADKYRKHDLRKDPNDLPKDAETVLTYELFDTGEKALIVHKIRYFKDGVFPKAGCELPGEIIAWKYFEPFEVEG